MNKGLALTALRWRVERNFACLGRFHLPADGDENTVAIACLLVRPFAWQSHSFRRLIAYGLTLDPAFRYAKTLMKQRDKKRVLLKGISKSRWTAYAAASMASAVACATNAEAVIHVVDVGEVFNGTTVSTSFMRAADSFQLAPGAAILLVNRAFAASDGYALFAIQAAKNASFDGFIAHSSSGGVSGVYASKLAFGANIAAGPFAPGVGTLAFENHAVHSQWLSPGQVYVGLKFDAGNGTQYGWVSLTMDGAGLNSFTLNSYAFGDVGDVVTAGEVPEPGSLALLAAGGTGLLAWRKRRAQKAATPAA